MTEAIRVTRLPAASPVCVHEWRHEPTGSRWVCAGCGYVVREYDLQQAQEGQDHD